jgi:hypothetical protein
MVNATKFARKRITHSIIKMCFALGACVEHATQTLDELIKFTLAQILSRYEPLLRRSSILQWWENACQRGFACRHDKEKFLESFSAKAP